MPDITMETLRSLSREERMVVRIRDIAQQIHALIAANKRDDVCEDCIALELEMVADDEYWGEDGPESIEGGEET